MRWPCCVPRRRVGALCPRRWAAARAVCLPAAIFAQSWTLTTLREKLIKIGAKVVAHARYLTFQLAEVAVPGELFARILKRIARLRPACASG